MPLDSNGLVELLKRTPDGATVRGFVFNAMLEHVAAKKGSAVATAVLDQTLRKRAADLLSYPAGDFFRLLRACAEALAEPAGLDEALRALGYASADGFFSSPMGKMLLGIVGRGDPARLMANAPTAYATSFSFGKRSFRRLGPREMELTHVEDLLPVPFNVGALEAAMRSVGATAQHVKPTPVSQSECRYLIVW